MKVNEEYIAKIEKLTNEGVGLAIVDNCVVFIQFHRNHKNRFSADDTSIISSSVGLYISIRGAAEFDGGQRLSVLNRNL